MALSWSVARSRVPHRKQDSLRVLGCHLLSGVRTLGRCHETSLRDTGCRHEEIVFAWRPKRINRPGGAHRLVLSREARPALSRTAWILVVVVAVAAVAAVEYGIGLGSNAGGPTEIDIIIHEDNAPMQIDHFYPSRAYATLGENVSIAVLNTDDEPRIFTILPFDINVTIIAGTTQRVAFQANKLGNFSFVSPVAPPSVISAGRLAPCLIGFFVVVQNASLLSSTTSSGQGAPGSTYCNPSNPTQNPPGYPPYSGPNPLNETL
jgi:Cupredoxin-like domain